MSKNKKTEAHKEWAETIKNNHPEINENNVFFLDHIANELRIQQLQIQTTQTKIKNTTLKPNKLKPTTLSPKTEPPTKSAPGKMNAQ